MDAFRSLNEDDGVTVIQVTHSEQWTAYGSRVVELHDGWVEADRQIGATVDAG
jgi:ABC-type lipoprotein export system ATPase subunit